MSDVLEVKIDDGGIQIIGNGVDEIHHLIRSALDDISDRVEEAAKILAPKGETGELKAHPVDIDKAYGTVDSRAHSIGGGFSARGASGRFVAGNVESSSGLISHIEITVADEPKHAKWVHEGTGIYGPHGTPIVPRFKTWMVYRVNGKEYRAKTVLGQKPQPYLEEAFQSVDRVYVPTRVERLRLEIQALLQ